MREIKETANAFFKVAHGILAIGLAWNLLLAAYAIVLVLSGAPCEIYKMRVHEVMRAIYEYLSPAWLALNLICLVVELSQKRFQCALIHLGLGALVYGVILLYLHYNLFHCLKLF